MAAVASSEQQMLSCSRADPGKEENGGQLEMKPRGYGSCIGYKGGWRAVANDCTSCVKNLSIIVPR